jgi:hypothetical protein
MSLSSQPYGDKVSTVGSNGSARLHKDQNRATSLITHQYSVPPVYQKHETGDMSRRVIVN